MEDRPERFSPDRIPGRMGIAEHERQRLVEAARRFRRSQTASERLLWQALRDNKLGVKFRRQHPIGPLIVDFCCPRLRLIVEVDGGIHDLQQERDAARQRLLEDRGYRVVRVTSADVERDLVGTLGYIASVIRERALDPDSPSPEAGEGVGG